MNLRLRIESLNFIFMICSKFYKLKKYTTIKINKIKEYVGILIKSLVNLIIGKNKCSLKLAV